MDLVKPDPVTGQVTAAPSFARAYTKTQIELIKDYRVAGQVVEDLGWLQDPNLITQYDMRGPGDDRDFRRWAAQRVIDGTGRPLDGRPLPAGTPLRIDDASTIPTPMTRRRIAQSLPVGVRAIDSLCTVGRGQRVGIFGGSGVGKSTLLGMIARGTAADVTVLALIGERGREVREFIEDDLGPEGLARSVVVVATSDEPALVRRQAAYTTLAIAEYFRDQGKDVLLLMDSVTRFALAQREIGLSAGEPPNMRCQTA